MAFTMMSAIDGGWRLGRRATQAAIVALASVPLLVAAPGDGHGRVDKREARQSRPAVSSASAKSVAAAPLPALRSAILIDAESGAILSETKPDMAAYPASLTKMMTLYLTFAALNAGRLNLDQPLPVSTHAAAQAPSKLWLKPGDLVPVQALILGLATRSANDAAVVLAEGLAGGETAFAVQMTETARRLGMNDTIFRNASGLPDPLQRTTARDIARLSLALYQDFPREYAYFSVRGFEFHGQRIATHNHMLESYQGADGIKTGFTRASGFNLAASAERDGRRLIGVVLGSPSRPVRDKEMAVLLDRGFAALGTTRVASADTVEPAPGKAKPGGFVAKLAAHASPLGKAIAAPAAKLAIRRAANTAPAQAHEDEDRTIQLGAFEARATATRLAKTASRLKPAKGKDIRILKIPGSKGALYAVQVSDFTDKGARDSCGVLRKAKFACLVLADPDEG